jgi:hypothetical protein
MLTETSDYTQIQEPYARYGLDHFQKKFGLSSVLNQPDKDIFIGYNRPETNLSEIQIILHPSQEVKICDLILKGETLPVFKRPIETSGEVPVAEILDEGKKYSCISISQNKIEVGFDILAEIGKILAGYYDDFFLRKDELGTCLRSIPVVDVLEKALLEAINQIIPEARRRHYFAWPGDHPFALVLTHDVDRVYKTYQYLPSVLGSLKKRQLSEIRYHLNNLFTKRGKNNPYWTFNSICELEDSLGVKSTYYFLNEKGRLNPFSLQSWILYRGLYDILSPPLQEIIKSLSGKGHEIGVHGSYRSYTNPRLLRYEKNTLESIMGLKVPGVRQHYLNYDQSITPDVHHEVGFRYDTSIGFKPDAGSMGFRRGTSFPFQMMLPDFTNIPLLEIPLLIMDGALENESRLEDFHRIMDRVEKYHGVLTILWHTNRFNNREYPTMAEKYENIIQQAKLKGAWIATAQQVYEWVTK